MNYVIRGKIASYPKRSSLIAPFQPELIEELQTYIPKTFQKQLTYDKVIVRIESKQKANPKLFEMATNNRSTYENDGDLIQLSIMEKILKIYQTTNPSIMAVSMIAYFILMIQFFRKKSRFQNYKKIFVLNGLLCLYLTRIITVAYVAATEYESAIEKCQYLANSYPVQSLFSILAIVFMVQNVMKHRKNEQKREEEI